MHRRGRSGHAPVLAAYGTLKTLSIVLGVFAFGSLGCSKEKLSEIANQVQTKGESLVKESKKISDSLVETAKEQLPESGHMTIRTSELIEIDHAFIKMHVVGDGRKNSLQITSYPPGMPRTAAPAVFIHSTTAIETVALLAGKTVPCNIFVEPNLDAAIARNEIGNPVSVVFGSMNMQEMTITATIEPCTLMSSDGQPLKIDGADVLAVVAGRE